MALNVKGRIEELRQGLRRLLSSPTHELDRWGRLAVYQIRLWRFAFHQLRRDRLVTVAGDLTFKTLLSIIPILVIVLLVINFITRGVDVGQEALQRIFDLLNINEIQLRVNEEEVNLASQINELVLAIRERTSAASALAMAFLFGLAINVLLTVESAMNRIWHAPRSRGLARRLAMFWLLLTFGPAVIVIAYSGSDWLADQTTALVIPGWLGAIARWVVGLVTVWFVLFVLYKMLPNVQVGWRAALTGALVAGTLWQVLAKQAFSFYIAWAVGYGQIYGSLGVVPLFFLWVWVTWIFTLFGCELGYVIQEFRGLARAEHEEAQRRECWVLAADFVALEVAVYVARRYGAGDGPTTVDQLVEATGLGSDHLGDLLDQMRDAGVLVPVDQGNSGEAQGRAWLPARPPERIPALDAMTAVKRYLPLPTDESFLPAHRRLREIYDTAGRRRLGEHSERSLADIVADTDGSETA